jgi:hypothetical protein
MKNQIEAVLSGVKDKAINKVGHLWQIRVGARAGARENGVSLARDLLREHREDIGETAPIPPVTDYDAIIADLKAQLAAKPAFEPHAEPETVDVPEFLKAKEDDMEFAADFIAREAQEGEDRAATIARLQLLFEVLTNRSYGGPLPDEDQARLSELTANLRLGG